MAIQTIRFGDEGQVATRELRSYFLSPVAYLVAYTKNAATR